MQVKWLLAWAALYKEQKTKGKGWLTDETFPVKLKGISCLRNMADTMSLAHIKYANNR